jgi:hypothetical protein
MIDPLLTAPILRHVAKLANALDSRYDRDNDDWCGEATEVCGEYLANMKIEAAWYYSNLCCMGGCAVDASHAYLVLVKCGTIIDPTVTQFIHSKLASKKQRATARGYPTKFGIKGVAVVPFGHPYATKMMYEAHMTGAAWIKKPLWWPKDRTLERLCKDCVKCADPETCL